MPMCDEILVVTDLPTDCVLGRFRNHRGTNLVRYLSGHTGKLKVLCREGRSENAMKSLGEVISVPLRTWLGQAQSTSEGNIECIGIRVVSIHHFMWRFERYWFDAKYAGIRDLGAVLDEVFISLGFSHRSTRLLKKKWRIGLTAGGVLPAIVGSWLKERGLIERLVYEDVDYLPDGYSGRSKRIVEDLEQRAIRLSDACVSVSRSLQKLRRAQGARETLYVPNGVDYDSFAPARSKTPHPPTIVYMGTLMPWSGIDIVVRALPGVLRVIPDAKFLIIGWKSDMPYYTEVRRQIENLGLTNSVEFLGEVDYRELPRILSRGDIGVATFPVRDLTDYSYPLKIVEYMAGGLPVVATDSGEMSRILDESQAGIGIDPSAEACSDALIRLFTDRELFDEKSSNAMKFAQENDWATVLAPELDLMERLSVE